MRLNNSDSAITRTLLLHPTCLSIAAYLYLGIVSCTYRFTTLLYIVVNTPLLVGSRYPKSALFDLVKKITTWNLSKLVCCWYGSQVSMPLICLRLLQNETALVQTGQSHLPQLAASLWRRSMKRCLKSRRTTSTASSINKARSSKLTCRRNGRWCTIQSPSVKLLSKINKIFFGYFDHTNMSLDI